MDPFGCRGRFSGHLETRTSLSHAKGPHFANIQQIAGVLVAKDFKAEYPGLGEILHPRRPNLQVKAVEPPRSEALHIRSLELLQVAHRPNVPSLDDVEAFAVVVVAEYFQAKGLGVFIELGLFAGAAFQ